MLAFLPLLNGCTSGDKVSDRKIAEAQMNSFLGPTKKIKFSDSKDEKIFSDSRNRAYDFCLKSKSQGSLLDRCFDEQDQSLIAARNSISYAELIQSNGLKIDEHEFGPLTNEFNIFHHPELWQHAKEYCYSIYNDAGRGDARMLGPCLSDAAGQDFFGLRAVP